MNLVLIINYTQVFTNNTYGSDDYLESKGMIYQVHSDHLNIWPENDMIYSSIFITCMNIKRDF